MITPKLGHIDFLNVLPLKYGLSHTEHDMKIIYGVPTFLNGELQAGRIDLSNISSIEYARQSEDLLILPEISVRADKEVTSIILISRRPIEKIRDDKIIITSASATAQCLLKIILHEYGASPKYEIRKISIDNPVDDASGALLIGDDALFVYLHQPKNFYVYDLGEEWHKLTGKQMIYGLWCVRKIFAKKNPALMRETYEKILHSFEYGIDNKVEAIFSVLANKNFTFAELDKYLGNIIKWNITEESLEGLKEYYKRAEELKLIKCVPEIKFVN